MTSSVATTVAPEPLVTRPFVALACVDLAYFTADGIAIYALPLQSTGPLGASEAGAGLAFGAFAVTALLMRPVAGRLTDTRGRLPVLAGGAALAMIGLAATAYVGSLGAMVALRLLLGVGEAMFFVASLAALADLAPPNRLGEAVSYNSLGLYVGLTVGPPLGQLLVAAGGFRTAWLGASALCAMAVVVAWLLLGETRDPAAPVVRGRLLHVPAIAPGIGLLASIGAMGGFLAFASVHAQRSG